MSSTAGTEPKVMGRYAVATVELMPWRRKRSNLCTLLAPRPPLRIVCCEKMGLTTNRRGPSCTTSGSLDRTVSVYSVLRCTVKCITLYLCSCLSSEYTMNGCAGL